MVRGGGRLEDSDCAWFDGLRPVGRILCGLALVLWGCTSLNPAEVGGDAGADGVPDGAAVDTSVDAAVDAASGGDAPFDAPADAPADAVGCGRYTRGPKMVAVPNGCIDSTEVTQAQYQLFLAAKNGDMSGQGPECTWNPTYGPALMCGFDPVGHASFPVNGVDWCDATAYCQWAGKRLCGHVGGGALIETNNDLPATGNMEKDLSRADISEWTAACSQGGTRPFPYGGALVPEACNGGEHSGTPRAVVDVGTTPGCVGGYPGLFDMAGNVHEWENACAPLNGAPPSRTDGCWFRGGSYHDNGNACTTAFKTSRDYVDADCDIGFRCCASP
jgi:formylglycine-generating enzyme required for sulfatase activity